VPALAPVAQVAALVAQVRVPELAQVPEQVRGRPAVPVAPAAAPLMSR
jgi:hypothetical protein